MKTFLHNAVTHKMLVNGRFGDSQTTTFENYVEASVMLQYTVTTKKKSQMIFEFFIHVNVNFIKCFFRIFLVLFIKNNRNISGIINHSLLNNREWYQEYGNRIIMCKWHNPLQAVSRREQCCSEQQQVVLFSLAVYPTQSSHSYHARSYPSFT